MAEGLIDTSVLIDILRGHPPAVHWIATQGGLAVSSIAHLELIEGARNKRGERSALELLRTFELISNVPDDHEWAIKQMLRYHLSHNVGAFDCLIAAPAYRLRLPLYTHNLKHFAPLLGDLARRPY